MSLEAELTKYLLSRPAFWQPIADFLAITGSTPPTNDLIKARVCWGDAPENITSGPYLVWSGPLDYDQGTVSIGAIDQKTARFWFTAYADFLDDAFLWINAIEDDFLAQFASQGAYHNITTVRLMSAIYQPNSKFRAVSDQTLRTANEFAQDAVTICYQLCWQPI